MLDWAELEFHHAKVLKASGPADRRAKFERAYSEVFSARAASMAEDPEQRTAGTSQALVRSLARLCRPGESWLEVGCGRGYTCWKLGPHVRSMTGMDVTDATVDEARALLARHAIRNADIVKGFADDIRRLFAPASFDTVLSIDVYEHLHPDDALEHLRQVYSSLKAGGRVVIVTPNRATGPHDVTRLVYPDAREPLGFHLNETTYRELVETVSKAGFVRPRAVVRLNNHTPLNGLLTCPTAISTWAEQRPQIRDPRSGLGRILRVLAGNIFLVARKP